MRPLTVKADIADPRAAPTYLPPKSNPISTPAPAGRPAAAGGAVLPSEVCFEDVVTEFHRLGRGFWIAQGLAAAFIKAPRLRGGSAMP